MGNLCHKKSQVKWEIYETKKPKMQNQLNWLTTYERWKQKTKKSQASLFCSPHPITPASAARIPSLQLLQPASHQGGRYVIIYLGLDNSMMKIWMKIGRVVEPGWNQPKRTSRVRLRTEHSRLLREVGPRYVKFREHVGNLGGGGEKRNAKYQLKTDNLWHVHDHMSLSIRKEDNTRVHLN